MLTVRRVSIVSVVALLAVAFVCSAVPAGASGDRSAGSVWLCRPGLRANPCEPRLTTTVYDNLGHIVAVRHKRPAEHPGLDCFYVYPTVSDEPTPQADFAVDPVLRSIALYQAAAYSRECRVFAPVYRQITLRALGSSGVTPQMTETAYQDVRHAFFDYLKHDNHGHGIVFVGHSQGSFVLRRLLREEIDPKPTLRGKLVSALLLGGNVTVATGSDRGGDFKNIPACRSRNQTGCVVAFSTFDGPVPPDSRFGRTTTPGQQVLCTNPAALSGGSAPISGIQPTQPFAPGTIAAANALLGLPPITATTPFVEFHHAYEAACSSAGGANVLQISPLGRSPLLHPVPDATWGEHLVDANIALADLVRLVDSQGDSWRARNRSRECHEHCD